MPVCLSVVYGDILHGMQCFDSVAQLRAPTDAYLATATGMLEARGGSVQFKA